MLHTAICPTCHQPMPHAVDGVRYDKMAGLVTREGYPAPVSLTLTKGAVFSLLLKHYGQYVHREIVWDVLYSALNECDQPHSYDIVSVHMYHLRAKLAPLALTVQGKYQHGYRLEVLSTGM